MPNTFLRYIHLICLCIVMQMAHAYNFEADGLSYTFLNSNQVEVSRCTSPTGNLIIPKTVTYNGETYQVTSIGNGVFRDCTSLTSVTIPSSVTSIGSTAFSGCSSLASVTIPNSVTSIGSSAFYGCSSLPSVTIPNSVTSIGGSAFLGCSGLISVTIPSSVTSIGNNAFCLCTSLTSVTIPNSVTVIETEAFSGCTSLASITIPNSVTAIGRGAFYGCSGLTSITIPNSLTEIGNSAFYGCSGLTSITIPNSITSIGEWTFYNCSGLTSITIPSSVTSIGKGAFYGCSGLTSITVPSSVTFIGYRAFSSCRDLTSVTIPNSITSIGDEAFYGCKSLKTVCTKITDPFRVNCFDNTSNATLIVPRGTISKYKYLNGWYSFKEIKEEGANYSIIITANGNGSASYNNTTIKGETRSFTIEEGCSATISFTPDDGYRIKSVKVNNTTVIVSNNQYTINNISANTTVNVEFEAIPPTTYTLSITSSGNGSATYDNTAVRNGTQSFTITEGASAKILFALDEGYRIKSVKVNNAVVTVSNNQYTINNISANTTVNVEFEAIPITTYTLSVSVTGNGAVVYNSNSVRSKTASYTLNAGASATVSFNPDEGYRIASVKLNDKDVTSNVANNQYTVSNITANAKLDVVFEAIPPTTYTLSITSSGNGSVTYNNTAVRNGTRSFSITEGASAKILFAPDEGYRIKSVKVNNAAVTVSNNQYTINNIPANTTVNVEFEAIPPTTYTLSITSSGNGSATYDNTVVRNGTQSFTINEGTSAKITFTPDNGYYVWKVKVNNSLVSVSNNQYTINNISDNTSVTVDFFTGDVGIYFQEWLFYVDTDTEFVEPELINPNNVPVTYISTDPRVATVDSVAGKVTILKAGATNIVAIYNDPDYPEFDCRASYLLMVLGWGGSETSEHILEITSSGNGQVTYEENSIRNNTISVSVKDGSSVTMSLMPDTGYRIAYVKRNGVDVTADVSNNSYTIEGISDNSTLDIAFEAIPPTTYTLSITSSGNGSVTYDNNAIRNNTRSFTINEGTSAAVSISPDDGYRIASVKLNGKDVTADVVNNQYTISSITDDTNLSIIFEAIPIITYTLSVKSTGNGSASYDGTTIQGTASSFTVNEGNDATIAFTPNEGYQIKDVKIDDVVVVVVNNQYTIRNITKDTTIEVVFEETPQVEPEPATYTLKIKATGNGSASFDDTTVKAETATFIVNEGSTAILSFSPDNGNSVSVVMLNGKDITDKAMNNRYVIDEITQDISFEVVFKEDINALTVDGINYKVVSQSEKTVKVVGGDYGQVLTIPATVSQDGTTWKVTGLEKDALKDIAALCAVIWEPEASFTADVSNPNLLLYVKDAQYAPADIKNVVVNGSATSITLVDANSGNGFFCPLAFTAQKISYTHHYGMITGIGESRGWETIALPFDVQTVTHAVKGACRPFANWKSGDDARPFWLYELTGSGFAEATGIEAYTPYVISMPNHPRYEEKWILRGNVTFAATNTVVKKTEDVKTVTYGDRTFVPCFADMAADAGFYALNVNNDLSTNTNGMTEGSRFVLKMRKIHPFEAYMVSTSNASRWYFDIFEDMTTAIKEIEKEMLKVEHIYDLQGRKTQTPHKKGIYVTDGKKLIVK